MVSVIIPAYNSGVCIGRAIDSVLNQTWDGEYEIIIVDDGSTDNTAEVVARYGEKVVYIRQENSGSSVARNRGIEVSKGEWIAFLDSDDEWVGEKLSIQMELLARNPKLRWCASNFLTSDGTRSLPSVSINSAKAVLGEKDYVEDYFVASAKGQCSIITSTIIVNKKLFKEVGLFAPELLRGQDTDMWWRIGHQYPQMGYIADPIVIIHLDLDNAVLNERRSQMKRGQVLRKLVNNHLHLAVKKGNVESFKLLAKKVLFESLLTTIYHGFKDDTRTTVEEFKEFFPWYWRVVTYALTVFPQLTVVLLRSMMYIRYKLGFEKKVSRRWIYTQQKGQNCK